MLTLPAAGATPFQPPEGCTLEMTVQMRGCQLSQHYRCAADPKGDQWAAYFDAEGPVHVSRIDAETRWVESLDPRTGVRDRLVEEAADHASLSTLLATGVDAFDFWTEDGDGFRMRHVGEDRLTGETVTIDGVELARTTFRLQSLDESDAVLISREGSQFVSRAHGRFYGGNERATDWTGEAQETDDTPVSFAFPGEPGFGTLTPQVGCDVLTAGWVGPPQRGAASLAPAALARSGPHPRSYLRDTFRQKMGAGHGL